MAGRRLSALEYHRLVGALATAARERDADLAEAERAYQAGAADAAAALARADAAASEAERSANAAASIVIDVDAEAARLWDELRHSGSWWSRMRRIGELPLPTRDEEPPGTDLVPVGGWSAEVDDPPDRDAQAAAVELLDGAAERITQVQRGAPRVPMPRWLLPLLPPLGAAAATMTGLVAGGLVSLAHFDSQLAWPLRLLGWFTFLIAPLTGVPPAALWVGRRFGSGLDAGAIGLIVLGGMAASCGLSLLFAR